MDTQPDEPRAPALRASDADRERVASLLQTHFADGRLTYDELQERLEQVYGARTIAQLDTVLEDLPAPEGRGSATVATRGPRQRRHERHHRSAVSYLSTYIIFCLFLVAIWAASGHHGGFWPIWPIIVFGALAARRILRSV